eukprot:2869984-Rhodomonas_salina.2
MEQSRRENMPRKCQLDAFGEPDLNDRRPIKADDQPLSAKIESKPAWYRGTQCQYLDRKRERADRSGLHRGCGSCLLQDLCAVRPGGGTIYVSTGQRTDRARGMLPRTHHDTTEQEHPRARLPTVEQRLARRVCSRHPHTSAALPQTAQPPA